MLELLATICGFAQSGLILINRRENWFFHMLSSVFLMLFSLKQNLYGDVLENAIYFMFGIFGLFSWYTTKADVTFTKYVQLKYSSKKERIFFTFLLIVITGITYSFLFKTNDPYPILDSVTTGLGFVATLMMALKRIDAWIVWLIDDMLMAVIYFMLPNEGTYLMLLNIVWIFLALGSWWNWHKLWKRNIQ